MNLGCEQCKKKKELIKKLRDDNLTLRKEISAMLKDAKEVFKSRNAMARELEKMKSRPHGEYSRCLKDVRESIID